MIPRISKGSSAYGALAYDHGPGRRDEHLNPHKVAGNVPGRTWQERAKLIDRHAREVRPDAVKPLHRTSLRISETDRRLTDREWKQVAHEYVQRMGFEQCPWEATRHADDHIHLTVNRVQWDGKLARNSNDYAKAQAVSRRIEKQHGLEDASRKFNRARPEVSKGEKESAQRRQVQPEREQLRAKLSAAERSSDGTRASYEAALTEQGVHHRANVSKTTGRVSGYSYGLAGHSAAPKGEPDKAREQVWFKGSQLGRDYSWQKTEQRLGERVRSEFAARGGGATDRQAPASTGRSAGTSPQEAGTRAVRAADAAPPMTRDQAREHARQLAADRREGARKQRGGHDAERATTTTDTSTPSRSESKMTTNARDGDKQKLMTQDQAREEAARRAAERDRQQRDRERETGRER